MYYLDHNATTPPGAQVVDAVCVVAAEAANPSSQHQPGQRARQVIETAAQQIRQLVKAANDCEVVFTSGATEADAMVLGLALARRRSKPEATRVVMSAIEHPAMLATGRALRRRGFEVTELAVHDDGRVDLAPLAAIDPAGVACATLMWAHNETGVLQPVAELVRWADGTTLVHSDAVQAIGKVPVAFDETGLDALSLTGHKFGGPRGVGALVLRKGVELQPLFHGGAQQRGLRPGTEPAALIAGLGVAAEMAAASLAAKTGETPRQLMWKHLSRLAGAEAVALDAPALGNTLMIGFRGVAAAELLVSLDEAGIAASAGAACHSDAGANAGVLNAMGIDPVRVGEVIRLSAAMDFDTTELVAACEIIGDVVQQLRARAA